MMEMLQWLLGLRRIQLAEDAPIALRFGTPPAPWIMLAGAVIAGLAVWLIYRRGSLSRSWRWALMLLRFGAVMTVLFICGRPMLVLSRTEKEPSFVAVLVDRSASMATTDRKQEPDAKPATRWHQVVAAVAESERSLLTTLAERHEVGAWTFGETAESVGMARHPTEAAGIVSALTAASADGARTNLGRAMLQVLRETMGRRVAGIVVVSDGRQTEPIELESVMAQAAGRSIPVHAIAAGATESRRDFSLVSVWAPEDVFVRDTVSVQYDAEIRGLDQPTSILIELRAESDATVLASSSRQVAPDQPRIQGTLMFRPDKIGRMGLVVRIAPDPSEENLENNEARSVINAHDERIGVLYVESVPRFEYRYLKNLLLREPNIQSSCILLEASPGFPQEGTIPLRRFPRSIEEMRPYDVVILGDVDPRGDWLTPMQQAMLVDFVSIHGGGLALIAGERGMPASLRRTTLEKLLPVEVDPRFSGRSESDSTDAFLPVLTPEGRQSPIFRLEADEQANEETLRAMPGLFWSARVVGPLPGAAVLAVHPNLRVEAGPLPLAVLGRFGAGRTFYLGTDELWRWRQYSGDIYHESIWMQVIRTLARGKKLGAGNAWRLETDRRHYELGDTIQVRLTAQEDGSDTRLTEPMLIVSDAADAPLARLALKSRGADRGAWEAAYTPGRAGNIAFSMPVPSAAGQSSGAAGKKLTRAVTISAHDPERAQLEADHELLRTVASRTGGEFHLLGEDLSALTARIPDRSVQIADDVEEPIWDSWFLLAFFALLVTAEWTLRRVRGLA